MKKRVLSLFMVLVLCLTLLPTAAFAEGEDMSLSGGETGGSETGGEGGGALVTPGSSTGEGGGVFVTPGSSTGEGGGVFAAPGGEAGEGGSGLTAPGGEAGEDGEGSGGTHYVAESGGTQYETVQEILDNMAEGEITLLDSVTEDLTVCAATTIHMNGHSITGNIDAMDSLTLNGGTVDGTVKVDGGTLNMTAPAEAEAAITGGLNVVSGSASVSGAQVGVKGTLYFDGTDMLISGAVKAVELDSAAKPAAKTLYGSATVNGDTAAEAGFDTDTYKVGGEIAKKLTNKQVGSTTPAAPSLTLTETSKSLTAGKTAVFTANYTGTDTLNAYVQGSAVNGYFTISQKNNSDGTYTVSVKIDEETPGGTYTLFVHELGNTSVQASATITVIGLPDAAEVSGKQYKSLPRALNAAQNGDTVKLLANHTTNWSDVEAGEYATLAVVKKTLTLDLNGMTVDYLTVGDVVPDEEGGILESYDGNLTVADNAQGGSCGKIKELDFVKGSLAIQGGRIGDDGSSLTCNGNSGTVIISGGTVCNATVGDGATVTVTGGTGHAGRWHNDGTLNITGGTFGDVEFSNNGGTIAISGGTFEKISNNDTNTPQPLMLLLAKDCAFVNENNTSDVQDGTKTSLTEVMVKEHTHSFENGKCDCGVATIVVDNNNSCYNTLQAALDAAADDASITSVTLGQDLNENVTFNGSAAESLTLNMNGHKLEAEAGVPLTVTGGTLRIEGAGEINQNTASNATAFPAISLSGGKLVITGDLTAQGGYDSSSGRKPAIYATDGELDLQGNVSLNGGLTMLGNAKLTNLLTKGTFYAQDPNGNATEGNVLAVCVRQEGVDSDNYNSDNYNTVLKLIADGYAIYKADGTVRNAAAFTLKSDTYSIGAHTCNYTHDETHGIAYCNCGRSHAHRNLSEEKSVLVNGVCPICGYHCPHKYIGNDGVCTDCNAKMVAKVAVGETTTYTADLADALNKAANGTTITLLADTEISAYVNIYAATATGADQMVVTLDLAGHTVTSSFKPIVIGADRNNTASYYGTLKIVGTGNITLEYATLNAREKGVLDLTDWTGGSISSVTVTRNGNTNEEGKLIVGKDAGHIGSLAFYNWPSSEITNTKLYGGSYGEITTTGDTLSLAGLLPNGCAFKNADGSFANATERKLYNVTVSVCDHGGKNGFDNSSATCPYCNAPAVAETALNNGQWRRFANLQTAIDADRDGGAEFRLLTDVTGNYTIDGTKDTGLDLNGHCIRGTVTVKGIKGDLITTTLSNTQNTTTASIDKVIAFAGAELGGSKYPAVIGELTLAEGATWKNILNDTALGYKVLNVNGTHEWYAWDDVKGSQLKNVIINRLPITSKTLYLWANGKKLTGNPLKVGRGTTVQLCAYCNTKDADVSIYIGETIGNNNPTYSYSKHQAEYRKIGTTWYYVVDLDASTIGTYDIYFTATKDGYSVTSTNKRLTVTKPNLSNAEITFPDGNEAAFNYVTATSVPNFIVTYNGNTLVKDVDYTISSGGSTYDVGPCTLTIQATNNGDYIGRQSAKWNVRPLKVAASVGDIIKTYDGTTDLPANAKITFQSVDSYYTGTTLRLAKGTDYEVLNAHYDSADASTEEKTVSFTIQLKNAGYVFEDGTKEKAFTLKGSETDKTFKINQASVNSPGEITLYVYNDAAKTYTINLASLRPLLTPPCEYGTTQYQGCNYDFTDGAYLVGTDAISVSKEGILTLRTVAVHSSDVNQKIGTITVPVVTTNYQKFEFTINVVIGEKIWLDQSGVTVTATDITYGQTLADSTLTATGSMICPRTQDVIPGTFAWTNPSTKPDASESYQAEWTFTPNEGYEEYAPATGKVTVKVNKATPTFNAPTAQENLTYTGWKQALITAGSAMDDCTMEYSLTENGIYSQDIPAGTDAGAYTVWYRVFGDANHNDTAPASVAVRIGKKPLTITWVTAASKPYDGTTNADITSVTFDGVNLNRGTDYTVTASFDDAGVGSVKNVTATVTLMGQAARNYALEQSSFPTTGSIIKAAAPDFTKKTALTIVNGHEKTYTVTLPALPTLETPKVYGALTYEIGEIKLNDGYYTSGAKVENGELTLPIQKNDVETTGSVGTVTVVIKSANYEDITLTVNVSAKNRPTPVLSGALTLTPARITYGDPLSKIRITGTMKVGDRVVGGTFSWQQPGNTVLDASDLGHDMGWRFTPEDENTYAEATGIAMVKVDKATQYGKLSMTGYTYGKTPSTPTLTDRTGDPNAQVRYTYSTADSGHVQTWDIQNPPALNAGTYHMFARIGQTSNYYEYHVGYCEFVVAKATPTYTKPTGLTAKCGQTLADVTLPDGWSWMDSSQSVGDASNTPKTFRAKFTPTDTENYNTVENIALEVAVNKADQAALTVQGADSVVYGQTLTLTATGGTGTGAVTYRMDTAHSTGEATIDPNTGVLTPVKVGSVSVIATKAGNKDYNDVTSAAFVLMIKPATPTGEPKYTQITASDKTLKDAALTIEGSTLNPHDGKLEWVDEAGNVLPDSTWVEVNTAYQWRFTPTDTNYTTLTGKIMLYRYYTIEATAETGGTISPSGNVGICGGEDQTFTITPNKGYAISNVRVDGKSIGAVKSYTFENVSRDHTILAIFMKANGNPQTGVFVDEATGRYYEDTVD